MKLKAESKAALSRVKNFRAFPHVSGATFNRDGSLFRGRHGDIVTVASQNVKAQRLSPLLVHRFALKHPKAKLGLFRLEKKRGFISMDANVIRSKNKRAANLRLARAHKQEAIFNLTEKQVIFT